MVSGALGLYDPNRVAYTLIAVNLAMIALGALVLGAWLRRRGVSAWFALVYGFYPGFPVIGKLHRSLVLRQGHGPIALAAALAVPYLPQRTKPWFWAAAALWLAPMVYWIVLPVLTGLEHLIVHGSA